MKHYEKYLISPTQKFKRSDFLFIADEMLAINQKTANLPNTFKGSIIISFLKTHSLMNNWIVENPQLAEMISSGTVSAGKTEALFESSRNNAPFQQELECYVNELIQAVAENGKKNPAPALNH